VLKRRRVEDHPVFSTFHSYCQKVWEFRLPKAPGI
jgi:hypothetical protein